MCCSQNLVVDDGGGVIDHELSPQAIEEANGCQGGREGENHRIYGPHHL